MLYRDAWITKGDGPAYQTRRSHDPLVGHSAYLRRSNHKPLVEHHVRVIFLLDLLHLSVVVAEDELRAVGSRIRLPGDNEVGVGNWPYS